MNVGKTSLSPYEEGTDSHVDKKQKKSFIDTRTVAYFPFAFKKRPRD